MFSSFEITAAEFNSMHMSEMQDNKYEEYVSNSLQTPAPARKSQSDVSKDVLKKRKITLLFPDCSCLHKGLKGFFF